MSFGKRGLAADVVDVSWRSALRSDFIKSSSSARSSTPVFLREIHRFWSSRIASDRLLYPLTCLALGLVLGGGIGAAVAPQLLQAAENVGVYDVIRMSAAMRAGAQRPAPLPAAVLGGPVFRVRLAPAHRSALRRRVPVEVAEAKPCTGCVELHYATPIEAILNDVTLRSGDTVMLKAGARVFRGGKRLPYTPDDFIDFRSGSFLTKLERQQIDTALGLTQRAQVLQAFQAKARVMQASLGERRNGERRVDAKLAEHTPPGVRNVLPAFVTQATR
jgi:hypothetical protein